MSRGVRHGWRSWSKVLDAVRVPVPELALSMQFAKATAGLLRHRQSLVYFTGIS